MGKTKRIEEIVQGRVTMGGSEGKKEKGRREGRKEEKRRREGERKCDRVWFSPPGVGAW